jgi:hypothetical protein
MFENGLAYAFKFEKDRWMGLKMSVTQARTEKNVKLAREVFANLDQILLIVNSHGEIFIQ